MPNRSDDRGGGTANHDPVLRFRAALGTGSVFPVESMLCNRAVTVRAANGFRAGLVLLILAATPVAGLPADSPAGPAKSEANAAAAKAGAERPPSLAENLTTTEALGVSERRIRQRLTDGNRVRALTAEIDESGKAFSSARRIVGDVPVGLVGFFELVDLAAAIRASDRRLTAATEELAAKAKARDADLDRLAGFGKEAGMWIQTARARDAPPAVLERIEALPRRIETLAQELRAHRDQILDNAALLLAIAIVAFALSYWLIVASRERLEAEGESDPYARRTGGNRGHGAVAGGAKAGATARRHTVG